MARRASAIATELQSMCCRLDAGRDRGSGLKRKLLSPTSKSYELVRDTYEGCQLPFRAKQRRANLICEDSIGDDQSE